MNNTVPVAAGGPDESVSEESDGMVRKAPQGQSLALSEVMQPAATTKQLCESPKDIEAPSMTILVVGEEVQPTAQKCGGVGGQRHSDAHALFARFATLSTLSTAVAPEHGNLNRLIRSGSHPTLDEPEGSTLDATGLRHVLRGVGLGVPNSTSLRPMLAEFGEVVGCQLRLTYAQFETLRAALNACGESVAVAKVQCAWRTWRARRAWHRALFARFATLSTLSTAVAPEHGSLNRLIRSGSHPTLDEPEAPTLDATGLRHVLRGVGLGVPNSTSVRPMLAEFGEVVGCQPRLTYAQFLTLRAALNAFGDSALSISTWRAGRARHRALFTRFATLSTLNPGAESLQPGRSSGFNNDCFHGKHCF